MSVDLSLITEDSIRAALEETRGDLFQVACLHRTTFREIDQFIKRTPALAQTVALIQTIKADDAYKTMSDKQFSDQVAYLSKQYRFEGLQIIHEIATMKADSAAMMEVKLRAATQLRGGEHHVGGAGGGLEGILKELADDYEAVAPRISAIRQTTVYLNAPEDTSAQRLPMPSGIEVLQPLSDGSGRPARSSGAARRSGPTHIDRATSPKSPRAPSPE